APVQRMRIKSRIVRPRPDEVVAPGTVRAYGWAWSGAAPIARVDVALDGGEGWTQAALSPILSPHAWRRWEVKLEIRRSGRHTLRTRATDAAGEQQPDPPRWNRLGYANNAVVTRAFSVR